MLLAFVLAAALAGAASPDARVQSALHDLYDGSTEGALASLRELSQDFPDDPLLPYFEGWRSSGSSSNGRT
jgi:hypothetical protein